jgi:hypothetical protein
MGPDRKASVMEERASSPLLPPGDQRPADRSLGSPLTHGERRVILSVGLERGAQMPKAKMAFFLGILSFFLMFIIGEPASEHLGNAGLVLTFILMAAYFFLCQFRLSRGNPNAYRKDWPVMLALDATWIIAGFFMILTERHEVVISQGLGILFSCIGATWAGAFAASMKARRKREQI